MRRVVYRFLVTVGLSAFLLFFSMFIQAMLGAEDVISATAFAMVIWLTLLHFWNDNPFKPDEHKK